MSQEYVPVDISNAPELQRLAEAVRRSGRPHALKQGTETVAVVRPAPKKESAAGSPPPAQPSRRSHASWMDDPVVAKRFENDLRANREAPVDWAALFPRHTPEELAQRLALFDEIQAHRHQRVIAPLTTADLLHMARAQEEEDYDLDR